MAAHHELMQNRNRSMGAGMALSSDTEMNADEAELHTLTPERQRARMGLTDVQSTSPRSSAEAMPAAEEIARREEAAKRGHDKQMTPSTGEMPGRSMEESAAAPSNTSTQNMGDVFRATAKTSTQPQTAPNASAEKMPGEEADEIPSSTTGKMPGE